MLEQRESAGDGEQKKLFPQADAFAHAGVLLIGINLLLRDEHGRVLGEVHAARVARAAVVLAVPASRAKKTQRGVAARAELRRIGIRALALRALHGSIVAGSRAPAAGDVRARDEKGTGPAAKRRTGNIEN